MTQILELQKQVEVLRNACLMYDRKIHEKDLVIDRYRSVMEKAVEALEGKYMRARTLQAINALRECLKEDK